MCLFLTVGVLPRQREGIVKALRAARLEVVDQPNPFVRERFSRGLALLLVTHGGCSCQLSLRPGSDERSSAAMKRPVERPAGERVRGLEQPPKTPRPNVALEALKAALTGFSGPRGAPPRGARRSHDRGRARGPPIGAVPHDDERPSRANGRGVWSTKASSVSLSRGPRARRSGP